MTISSVGNSATSSYLSLLQASSGSYSQKESSRSETIGATQTDSFRASMEGLNLCCSGKPPPMTEEQAAEISQHIQEKDSDMFTEMDTNEDGALSVDELESARPRGPHGGPPPAMTEDMANQISQMMQEQDSDLFAKFDKNEDGSLSVDELASARPPKGPPPSMTEGMSGNISQIMQEQFSELFTGMDTDENGSLSANEFQNAYFDTGNTTSQQDQNTQFFQQNVLMSLLGPSTV